MDRVAFYNRVRMINEALTLAEGEFLTLLARLEEEKALGHDANYASYQFDVYYNIYGLRMALNAIMARWFDPIAKQERREYDYE